MILHNTVQNHLFAGIVSGWFRELKHQKGKEFAGSRPYPFGCHVVLGYRLFCFFIFEIPNPNINKRQFNRDHRQYNCSEPCHFITSRPKNFLIKKRKFFICKIFAIMPLFDIALYHIQGQRHLRRGIHPVNEQRLACIMRIFAQFGSGHPFRSHLNLNWA